MVKPSALTELAVAVEATIDVGRVAVAHCLERRCGQSTTVDSVAIAEHDGVEIGNLVLDDHLELASADIDRAIDVTRCMFVWVTNIEGHGPIGHQRIHVVGIDTLHLGTGDIGKVLKLWV